MHRIAGGGVVFASPTPGSCILQGPDHAQALQNHLQAESDMRDAEHDGKHLKHGPDSSEDRLGKQHRHPIEGQYDQHDARPL